MDILIKVENLYISNGKYLEMERDLYVLKFHHQWDVLFLDLRGKE